MAEMPDDKLVPLVLGELRDVLGISGDPIYQITAHWPRTMPQYHVGHLDLVARINERCHSIRGLALAGNAYDGVGIPACIHSGEEAAERLVGGQVGCVLNAPIALPHQQQAQRHHRHSGQRPRVDCRALFRVLSRVLTCGHRCRRPCHAGILISQSENQCLWGQGRRLQTGGL